mgnify:CR=1 FL=1
MSIVRQTSNIYVYYSIVSLGLSIMMFIFPYEKPLLLRIFLAFSFLVGDILGLFAGVFTMRLWHVRREGCFLLGGAFWVFLAALGDSVAMVICFVPVFSELAIMLLTFFFGYLPFWIYRLLFHVVRSILLIGVLSIGWRLLWLEKYYTVASS